MILGVEPYQKFPPALNKEEETRFFELAKKGDKKAREKLIEHNLRLVAHIVRKYYVANKNTEDLISVGTIGLVKAVDSFDNTNGTKFATYAAKCIQNEILMMFRSQKKLSCEVSLNDTIDIDKDGNPLTYLDIIGADEGVAENIEMKIYVEKLLSAVENLLCGREKEIIVLRYGLMGYEPKTQREVAKHLGISRSYVSRIEKKALSKMKLAFGAKPNFED
jgi:RNA polymerase sporulation-specific sigma factor